MSKNPQQKWFRVSQTEGAAEQAGSILFSVLCMHDCPSSSDAMLSFQKGEILDITQRQDDSGWWAAMRSGESKVGWISKSYVQQLSKEMAEKLRNIPQVVRVHEFNAEQLYNSPVGSGLTGYSWN
ncbi:hypothetical protein BYT27DRAFT_7206891 [Phlegmacium glaucopus]|nr:hypothetical protein BYT27DRAFT_7206891 [Phlegmacium glaucopus]